MNQAKKYGWIEGKLELIWEGNVDTNDLEFMNDLKDSNDKRSEYVDLSGNADVELISALIKPLKSSTDWTVESVRKAHEIYMEGTHDLDDIAFDLRTEFKVKFKEGSIKRTLAQESNTNFSWEGSKDLRNQVKDLIDEGSKSRKGFTIEDQDYIYDRKVNDGASGSQIAKELSDRMGRKVHSASVNQWIKKNITNGSFTPNLLNELDREVKEDKESEVNEGTDPNTDQ